MDIPALEALQTRLGSVLEVMLDGQLAWYVLRPVDGIKPVFVSPGHQISLATSTAMIHHLTGPYRICEPLRATDQACHAAAKGESMPGDVLLHD